MGAPTEINLTWAGAPKVEQHLQQVGVVYHAVAVDIRIEFAPNPNQERLFGTIGRAIAAAHNEPTVRRDIEHPIYRSPVREEVRIELRDIPITINFAPHNRMGNRYVPAIVC